MMAVEGPFLAAVIARLPEAKINLAAYGVAFAIAMLVESPVVMLMTASTALAEDAHSFRRLRRFAFLLNAGTTGVLLFVLVPAVFDAISLQVLALPAEVALLVEDALWLLVPWPAAIGYRRFYQGLLIRDGRPRLVAAGTVTRISAIALTALALARLGIPGTLVAAGAMTAGVSVEAAASRWMARGAVARILARDAGPGPGALNYAAISRFYTPLALTSLLGFAAHPLLTFFMGRAPAPVESLAVFPVVGSLAFIFRAVCLAYQEVTIALLGARHEQLARRCARSPCRWAWPPPAASPSSGSPPSPPCGSRPFPASPRTWPPSPSCRPSSSSPCRSSRRPFRLSAGSSSRPAARGR